MKKNHHTLNRRRFLHTGLALGASSAFLSRHSLATEPTTAEYWISAQGRGPYGFAWIDAQQGRAGAVDTDFRGHGAAQHPLKRHRVLLFARRPGRFAVELDLRDGSSKVAFRGAADRHLFGHGCFSHDGQYLYTTEADFQTGAGKVVVRDGNHYKTIGEFDSHGIGPHEIKSMPDGDTLVVANGGIQTHPDSGRKKLNLDTMASRLSYINRHDGRLIAEYQVPESKASIRHLDVASDGTVAIAMQVQRSATQHNDTVPLAAIHKPGQAIQLLREPQPLIDQMQDYMGSVAINNRSRIAGFTSPKGNVAAFWHLDQQAFVGYHRLHDVCGLAVSHDQQHFVVSNSQGQLRQLDAHTLREDKNKRLTLPKMAWDNHLLTAAITTQT